MADVVLVDKNDNEIGLLEKVKAHLNGGNLHRAFTIFIFDKNGKTLIAQRSIKKMLWPLYWDSACASHPVQNEGYVEAGKRRLLEELGFLCDLEVIDRFEYKEKYQNLGSENEVCTTLIGYFNGDIHPVSDEVADYKWISIGNLKKDMVKNPNKYAIWFKIALDRLIDQGKIKQES
jgi:isopentenyl-diphosphate delta-isomerase